MNNLRSSSDVKLKFSFVICSLLIVSALAAFAAQPAVNSPAPAFTLKNQDGVDVSLADLKGKWVVLYFYPQDMDIPCTLEAHNFQRDLDRYDKKNAVIVGISTDSSASHKQFCAKEKLDFRLLSDSEKHVISQYSAVWGFGGFSKEKTAARITFLIDPEGIIRKIYLIGNSTVKLQAHSRQVLADLNEFQKAQLQKAEIQK